MYYCVTDKETKLDLQLLSFQFTNIFFIYRFNGLSRLGRKELRLLDLSNGFETLQWAYPSRIRS